VTAVRERERDLPELDAERDVDLRRHWDTITTHWWLPVVGLVAGIVVGYLISLGGAQIYKAKATVYLGQPLSQGGLQLQSQSTNPSTVRTIVTSDAVVESVAREVGLRPGQLRGRISTQAISGAITRLGQNPNVAITVTGHFPGKVGAAANQLARRVVTTLGADYAGPKIRSLQLLVDTEKDALAQLDKQIKAQQAALAGTAGLSGTERLIASSTLNGLVQQRLITVDQLTTNQQQLLLAKSIEAPQVLTRALATKTTARSRRNTVIVAALIGLLLGIVAALVYGPATRAVRSRS
jgi:capsular polysaccharide biosynthesis protein